MSEYVTYAKVGTTAAILQMLEDGVVFRDLTLENPIKAIREITQLGLADAKALEKATERHRFLKECRVVIVADAAPKKNNPGR